MTGSARASSGRLAVCKYYDLKAANILVKLLLADGVQVLSQEVRKEEG